MQLLAGPTDASVSSNPTVNKASSVTIQNDGIHVDLSQEFTTGGGSASMSSRVAQVLYTATSLQQMQVWIDIEGKPLEVLGGEGLLLEQPLTRKASRKTLRSSALLFYPLSLPCHSKHESDALAVQFMARRSQTRLHNSKIMSSSTL